MMARLAGIALALALLGSPVAAEEAWTVERFHVDIDVRPDGGLVVVEQIDVDFGGLAKHGIFRTIPVRYAWDESHDRAYRLSVNAVTDVGGRSWPYEVSSGGSAVIKIGDPERTISGKQTYRIAYRVVGAINAFADHDELFWNVNGSDWPVPSRAVSAAVALPRAGIERVTCFQGPTGSSQSCRAESTSSVATFAATRALAPGEQLTIVVGLAKGVVTEPTPLLERRPRDPDRWFEPTPVNLGGFGILLLAGLTLAGYNWYLRGRDRAYVTNYYLTNNPAEDVRPLFGGPAIVPEYEPPDKLRPAQLGLLLDEMADPKDVTATIVDLATRGFLTIADLPAEGVFGKRDWKLTRQRAPESGELADYERRIFEGLFDDRSSVTVSELKGKFVDTLKKAQSSLYKDAVSRQWFATNPESTRLAWAIPGIVVVIAGAVSTPALGATVGAGLVGLAIVVVGLALLFVSRAMPARTARGSDLLRRILGFRMYMLTAEEERAAFAEREGIFSAYLPYAIVFGCVQRWAAAFADLGVATHAASWYTGSGAFDANALSSDLSSFSSSLSSVVASTPGGSGGSW
jgi:uncharacterized membrane protein